MRSKRPKVLHTLRTPPLQHVLDAVAALGRAHRDRHLPAPTGAGARAWPRVRARAQLGTGHALQQAVPLLDDDGITLVLSGDVPLIETETLQRLVAAAGPQRLALLTVELADPRGYGRVVRGAGGGAIEAVVEEKDATDDVRANREIYTGIMAAPTRPLKRWLVALRNDNAAGEYYLTDVVSAAVGEGIEVAGVAAQSETEVLGVNSPAQLADLERRHQRTAAARLMANGVRITDPARFDQRGELRCGTDVEIDVGCIFEGTVELGDGVRVGALLHAEERRVAGARIPPYTVDGAALGASIGRARWSAVWRPRGGAVPRRRRPRRPSSRSRTRRSATARRRTTSPPRRDATLGEARQLRRRASPRTTTARTAPHDHRRRRAHRQQLRARRAVEVGTGATIGGGSTISKDARRRADDRNRTRQTTLRGWKRPVKR